MERAANSMLQDGFSVRKAAEVFGVHKSTLGDRKPPTTISDSSMNSTRRII